MNKHKPLPGGKYIECTCGLVLTEKDKTCPYCEKVNHAALDDYN